MGNHSIAKLIRFLFIYNKLAECPTVSEIGRPPPLSFPIPSYQPLSPSPHSTPVPISDIFPAGGIGSTISLSCLQGKLIKVLVLLLEIPRIAQISDYSHCKFSEKNLV
jgi:hypothetical protein